MTHDELAARFPVGVRVDATAEYRKLFPRDATGGVVVGYGHDPNQVRVRRDGHQMADTFHAKFWHTGDTVARLQTRVAELETEIARLRGELGKP